MTTAQLARHKSRITRSSISEGIGGLHDTEVAEVALLHAKEDEACAAALEEHAAPIVNLGMARIWRSTAIVADELRHRSQRACILVVLLSVDLFKVPELVQMIEQAISGGKRILLVLARPCFWQIGALEHLRALPPDGRPLALQRHPEDAYAKVIAELGDLLKYLPQLQPRSMAGSSSSVRFKTDEIFSDPGFSHVTYVEPVEHEELSRALKKPDCGLVVQGPSGIGKTTATRHALQMLKIGFSHLLPGDPKINVLRRPEDVQGWVVIDDFHALTKSQKLAIASLLKNLRERPGNRKLILVGTGPVTDTLRRLNKSLRVQRVDIQRQPKQKIGEYADKVGSVLNITLTPRSLLTDLACGSFALASQLAMAAIKTARIAETVPRKTIVKISRSNVVSAALGEVRAQYEDGVLRFIKTDAMAMPARQRGLCLALLWLVSITKGGSVRMSDIPVRYPQFADSRGKVDHMRLATPLHKSDILSECIKLGDQEVSVFDPQFLFYLQNESFRGLVHKADMQGIASIDADNLLRYHARRVQNRRARSAAVPLPMIRHHQRFWEHRDAEKLRQLLAEAYVNRRLELLHVAQRAGVPMTHIASHERADIDVARDILDLARGRSAVRPLLEELRKDDSIASYWPELDRLLS